MIRFRPHHVLCTVGFEGKGYSPEFVQNYTTLAEKLRSNDSEQIQIVPRTDSICSACPHQRGALCETQEKIDVLDQAHSRALGIQPGQTLSWKEAKSLVRQKISDEVFDQICSTCSWQPLGMCKRALRELRHSS